MTKPDLSATPENFTDASDRSNLKRVVFRSLGAVALLFLLTFAMVFTKARLNQGGLELADYAILGAAALLTLVIGAIVWRLWPARNAEPEASSVKHSRMFIYGSMGVGALLGVMLIIGQGPDAEMLSNSPINPVVAGFAIAVWLIFMPVATLKWMRTVDEHEAEAYREGAFIAGHLYLFLAPAWWMATRAGWLPAQDPMIVFVLVCVVWTVTWFVKRYL